MIADALLPREEELVNVNGVWVEGDALRIAEKVQEFDSRLRVQYLEEAAKINEPPFRVVERCRDGVDRVVITAWKLDDRIIERLYAADTERHGDLILKKMDANNAKLRADAKQRYKESVQEAGAMAAAVLASAKDTYKLHRPDGKLIKITPQGVKE